MIDNIFIVFEDAFESQLSRMNCQRFSTGLSSGDFAGSGKIDMFSGTMRLLTSASPPDP
jgi:hypothetical protein